MNFVVSPNPQGYAKWRDMPFFKFDRGVADRYKLFEHFTDVFSGEEAAPSAPSETPALPARPRAIASANRSMPMDASEPTPSQAVSDPSGKGPQRNRVTPTGEVIATRARGTFMGNRADAKRWLVCELEFERTLMEPRKYTKLFFLDEAVALSSGHRPCQTCRRTFYRDYVAAVRARYDIGGALELDTQLNAAREGLYTNAPIRSLPDGVFVSLGDHDYRLVWQGALHRWTPEGYVDPVAIAEVGFDTVPVLTPEPSVVALNHGYSVAVHPSVGG